MISLPININDSRFLWNLDLFWYAHQQIYADDAKHKAYSAIISDGKKSKINLSIKYKFCKSHKQYPDLIKTNKIIQNLEPLNVQIALKQVLFEFNDDVIIELIDHDMFHFKKHPKIEVEHDHFLVCDLYEKWHLHSLTSNKHVIEPFVKSSNFYNGGHVPIIGTVKTFKKILDDWIKIHVEILLQQTNDSEESKQICWWAGMYSFNAVCEIHQIKMISKNYCYIPDANNFMNDMYIGHYSVDHRFNKRNYPLIYDQDFLNNDYYNMIRKWIYNKSIERWKI